MVSTKETILAKKQSVILKFIMYTYCIITEVKVSTDRVVDEKRRRI